MSYHSKEYATHGNNMVHIYFGRSHRLREISLLESYFITGEFEKLLFNNIWKQQ
jgi:hypothetical protein